MLAANTHPQSAFALAPHQDTSRRHSAAPFSLTALLPPVDSAIFDEHDASGSTAGHDRHIYAKVSRSETIFHRMGRKLSTFLPRHERSGTLHSLRIPMQTEIRVERESNSDDGQDTAIYSWLKSSAAGQSHQAKANGGLPSTSSVSISSSLGRQHTKRKPAPIFVPDSSDATNTCIEQVYPNGEPCEANTYSSHTMRLRSYSVPSANSEQSFPSSSPLRHYPNNEAKQNPIINLPPIPPRSLKRFAPITHDAATGSPPNRTVQTANVRAHSLSTLVKALFGTNRNGRIQSKKAAMLVSRTSSLKKMKNASHYPNITNHAAQTRVSNVPRKHKFLHGSEPKQMLKRRQKEGPQSFLPITTLSSR